MEEDSNPNANDNDIQNLQFWLYDEDVQDTAVQTP